MSLLLSEIKQDLYGVRKKAKKGTLLEMVFDDDMDFNPQEIDNPGYDTSAAGPEPDDYPQQPNDTMKPIQGTLPSENAMDPEIQSILSNIRLAVIQGLAKLAEKPQSVEYDTLKRILTIVDKPIETQSKQK